MNTVNDRVIELLSCDGVAPTGPCSPWPQERIKEVEQAFGVVTHPNVRTSDINSPSATTVKAGIGAMAKGLVKNAATAITKGKVSQSVYDERWSTCQKCPSLIQKTSRCSECGCFMKAKAWINGDKDVLCPLMKWAN